MYLGLPALGSKGLQIMVCVFGTADNLTSVSEITPPEAEPRSKVRITTKYAIRSTPKPSKNKKTAIRSGNSSYAYLFLVQLKKPQGCGCGSKDMLNGGDLALL